MPSSQEVSLDSAAVWMTQIGPLSNRALNIEPKGLSPQPRVHYLSPVSFIAKSQYLNKLLLVVATDLLEKLM